MKEENTMKRVFILCSMLSLLVGCSNDFEEINQQPVGGVSASGLPTTISASVPEFDEEEEVSRTKVVRDQHVLWQNSDAIAYFANVTKAKYVYNGRDGVTSASFDLVEESGISRILYTNAVYPYDAATGCTFVGTDEQLSVVYPAVQSYAMDSFGKGANLMVAKGTTAYGRDESLAFRNACGYFTIKLYSSKNKPVAIQSIKLTALGGEKIAGPATIIAHSDAAPEITMSSEGVSEVTLNCGNGGKVIGNDITTPTEFWFALPPTTFERGVRIEVVDVEGTTYVKKTDKKIVVERNKIKPMAAIKFAYPTDNQLWYTRHSDSHELLEFYGGDNPFDATITDHRYDEDNKLFVIEFDKPLTVIKETAFKSMGLSDESKDVAFVYLPEKLTTIEEEAFEFSGITKLEVPGSVTYIGVDALILCGKLESITFYPSPTNTPLEMEITTSISGDMGPFAFNGVVQFTYINVNRNIILTKDGEPFTPDNIGEGIFSSGYRGSPAVTLVVGEQVPEIYPYMFSGCSINNVNIPEHITKISDGAFASCYKLASITIPKTVKSIGVDAFYNTESLHTVIIEDSDEPLQLGISYGGELGTIQRGAFYFSPLKNIHLGRDIDYRDGDEPFEPSTWDEGVFACKNYDNEELKTTLTISSNVTKILEWMFSGARMEKVTIPASVKTIENRAFEFCYVLKEVKCERATPPTLGLNVFHDCDELTKIYVPASSVTSYKNAENWSDYADYIMRY